MKKITSSIRRNLRNQLIAVFVTMSLCITCTLILLTYSVFSRTLQKNYVETSTKALRLLEAYISSYFENTDNATIQLYSDAMLSPEYYTSESDDYRIYTYLQKKLQTIYLQCTDANSVHLYLAGSGAFYTIDPYSSFSTQVDPSFLGARAIQRVLDSNRIIILPPCEYDLLPEQYDFHFDPHSFTVARSISLDDKVIAVLLINYSSLPLSRYFRENTDSGSTVSLYDPEGRYLAGSSPDPENLDPDLVSRTAENQGVFQYGQGRSTQLCLYRKAEDFPLMLLKQIPMETVLQQARSLRSTLLLLSLCFIFVVVSIIIVISRRMTGRIVSLKKQINNLADGDFNITLDVRGEDEISDISRAFLNMSQKIQALIREKYVAELATQKAAIQALNAQINPHFLYNTLQTISSIAHREDVPEIEIMMHALSNMMRYAIKPPEDADAQKASVARELGNCEDYLKLLSYRYGDRLLYSIYMDEEARDLLIPRLSMQPLVENAVVHGMEAETESLALILRASVREGVCTITVTDNGRGMEPEELQLIRRILTENTPASHLGLHNVYTRLKLLYGENFQFRISSIPHRKTCITITFTPGTGKEAEACIM